MIIGAVDGSIFRIFVALLCIVPLFLSLFATFLGCFQLVLGDSSHRQYCSLSLSLLSPTRASCGTFSGEHKERHSFSSTPYLSLSLSLSLQLYLVQRLSVPVSINLFSVSLCLCESLAAGQLFSQQISTSVRQINIQRLLSPTKTTERRKKIL